MSKRLAYLLTKFLVITRPLIDSLELDTCVVSGDWQALV